VAVVHGATAITVNPSEMKNGEAAHNLTVSRAEDGTIRIERDGHSRAFVIGPSGPRIMMDGIEGLPRRPFGANAQTWFVCPKDHTMLRVPAGQEDKTYKCPVDGTTMEKRKSHGFAFFFDDFETDSL
jgi:hypothetical protein